MGLAFRYETTGGDGDEKTVVVLADNSREKVKSGSRLDLPTSDLTRPPSQHPLFR